MNQQERRKAYLTIVLSMILGLVCFALAGVFFNAAFAQELTPRGIVVERQTSSLELADTDKTMRLKTYPVP
jgi:hypothetical protein